MERVQEKLKLYRASVLKAAVEGALTAEWCAKNPQAEPASELLKRILVERRRRWEEDQLAKFKSKGQEPPKNWKAKYKEPLIPDTANLNLLPKGWYWVTLDQAAWQLRSGTAETSGRDKTHYPVLKSSAVRHRIINFNDLNYLQKEQSSAENFLKQDDFLITRLSGSVDYVGCTAVVKDALCERIQYPDRIFCAKLVSLIEGTYLSYCFQNSQIRQVLQGAAKSTAGHKRISMSDLYPLVIPLPPEKEQKVIIEIVEGLLSVIDHLESELETKLKTSQSLRQSILHHAFTGRLVPQDPKDEPASELLKRIASEREARAKEVASAKRQPKVKSAKAGKGRRSKQQHQGER
ncbi:MAG: restriction endonuclease subunit S [Deltaproteobacteria bacterium]|nr:restriction endonuclease subunit S [Deltaproteobacteria bacterium]